MIRIEDHIHRDTSRAVGEGRAVTAYAACGICTAFTFRKMGCPFLIPVQIGTRKPCKTAAFANIGTNPVICGKVEFGQRVTCLERLQKCNIALIMCHQIIEMVLVNPLEGFLCNSGERREENGSQKSGRSDA